MKCPGCGSDNPEGHSFCSRCGAALVKPVDIRDDRLKDAKGYLLKAIARRKSTDKIVSWAWILAIIVIFIATIITMISIYAFSTWLFAGGFFGSYATISLLTGVISFAANIATTAIFAYLAFIMVKRQNDHFARDRAIRQGILTLLRSAYDSGERGTLVMNEFAAMNAANMPREDHHDEKLWGIVMVLPLLLTFAIHGLMYLAITGTSIMMTILIFPLILLIALGECLAMLYLLYFLGKQMYEHDERWFVFEQNAKAIMWKLRWPQMVRLRQKRLEKREFWIYLVVTIFFPPFVLYWWYALIKDPNEHFMSQWEFEDALAQMLSK